LGVVAWLRDRNAGTVVALHGPAIGRMGLPDVDHHERRSVLVAAVEVLDVAGLGAGRAAGGGGGDEGERARPPPRRQGGCCVAVTRREREGGAGCAGRGPGLERADLLAEQAADQSRFRGPVRSHWGAGWRAKGFLNVRK